MKRIFIILSVLILTSCSRYHFLPRATIQKKSVALREATILETAVLTPTVKTEEQHLLGFTIKKIPPPTEKSNIQIRYQKLAPASTKLEKYAQTQPLLQSGLGKKEPPKDDYKIFGWMLLGSIALIIVGIILTDIFDLILVIGIVLFLSFLAALLGTWLTNQSSYSKKKKMASNNPRSKLEEGADDTSTQTKELKRPTDQTSFLFFYLLIANFFIWLSTKWKDL